MRRFFADSINGKTALITDIDQLHHLHDVLRLSAGDAITLVDGSGGLHEGNIIAIDKHRAEVALSASRLVPRRRTQLTIACAIPKADRMDDVIDSLIQLGVARIIPVMTERVVVKLDGPKKDARRERWQKIARSAVIQSGRSSIPDIAPVTDYADVIAQSGDYDLKLIPHLEDGRRLIKDVLTSARPANIIVLIGPEGDFTPAEISLALEAGFIPVSLGDTVLRVATAAVAAAAYIQFALDE